MQLVADSIHKAFRGIRALDDVSLRAEEREIVGLIGPNGSGKTTLLNIASGVLAPTDGRIIIGGIDATGRPPHEFARLGIARTFQQTRLFEQMTVEQHLTLGAISQRGDEQLVALLLDRFSLWEDRERLATTLPHGQQRCVEIARGLAGRPRFLLLDEPAAGLNEKESQTLLEAIRAARDEIGCGVLVVDHDLGLIMRLCSRIHVLANGKTICEGTPEIVRGDQKVIEAYLGTPLRDTASLVLDGRASPASAAGGRDTVN
jgi:ABC-type branched-subunit amino acid transport system ATPase component